MSHELSQEEKQEYKSAFELAFQSRMDAQLGDGCIEGLNKIQNTDKQTIEILFREEPHFFVMLEGPTGVWLIPKSAESLPKEEQHSAHIACEYGDEEELFVYQQLLANNWTTLPETMEF